MLSRSCCLTFSTVRLFRTQAKESKAALVLSLPLILVFDPMSPIKLSRPDTPLRHLAMELRSDGEKIGKDCNSSNVVLKCESSRRREAISAGAFLTSSRTETRLHTRSTLATILKGFISTEAILLICRRFTSIFTAGIWTQRSYRVFFYLGRTHVLRWDTNTGAGTGRDSA
jgi:hypothetical protein